MLAKVVFITKPGRVEANPFFGVLLSNKTGFVGNGRKKIHLSLESDGLCSQSEKRLLIAGLTRTAWLVRRLLWWGGAKKLPPFRTVPIGERLAQQI